MVEPRCTDAQVAELADALASGASSRKGVEVRVLSWAPNKTSHQAIGTKALSQPLHDKDEVTALVDL
jgi:hypothetical protein